MQDQSAVVPVSAVFCFDSHPVRTIEIDDEPWFVAKDVADALGYVNTRKAIRTHCKHPKTIGGSESVLPPNDFDPQTVIVRESDVYRLIIRSSMPEADKFEDWIMNEVLPSIRKHGHYSPAPVPALPTDPMQLLKLTYDALEQVATRVSDVEAVSLETKNRLDDFEAALPLRHHEARSVQVEVTAKVAALEERHGIHRRMGFMAVYGFIKRHFQIPTYSCIPSRRFDEALSIIKGLTLEQLPPMVRARGGAA